MSRTTLSTPLAFKPWNVDTKQEPALADVLARVNNERGHFRTINEASLQEELSAQGALDLSSSDEEDEDRDEDVADNTTRKTPTTREDLFAARHLMSTYVHAAQQDIAIARDFISLLESKYAPSQASVSMSRDIKGQWGIPNGSLGTDVWAPNRPLSDNEKKREPSHQMRETQDKLLASTVRMDGLEKIADALLSAATRLRDNVRKETVFWDQILNISERGWNVSKLHKHMLGVHIGSSDTAAKGVAALYSDGNGHIALERSVGTKPRAIRAIVRRGSRIIGSSRLPSLPEQDETALDARVRHARDSVYDEELFHEMVRETRDLVSAGVVMKGSTLGFATGPHDSSRLEFSLVALDEQIQQDVDISHDSNQLAEAALLVARLLLGQEHRKKGNTKRELPKPMSEKKTEETGRASILRPLLLLCRHHAEVSRLNIYLQNTSRLLRTSGTSAESQDARIALATSVNDSIDIDSLLGSLTRPVTSDGTLFIILSDDLTLDFKLIIETSATTAEGSKFTVHAPRGVTIDFSSMQEGLEATDEFIALALSQVARTALGEGWALDEREGLLQRTSQVGSLERFWFSFDSTVKTITLHYAGSHQEQETIWKLEGGGESRGLKDVCKDLAG